MLHLSLSLSAKEKGNSQKVKPGNGKRGKGGLFGLQNGE